MFELIKNNKEMESIDSLFNHFFNDTFLINNRFLNQLDSCFSDDDDNYYLELALPGLDKKDISLIVKDRDIHINYESKNDASNAFWHKSFNRKIKLPDNTKSNGVSAELKNGILSIAIKKDKVKESSTVIDIK